MKKMLKKLLVPLLIFGMIGSVTLAQQEKPPKPPGPTIKVPSPKPTPKPTTRPNEG